VLRGEDDRTMTWDSRNPYNRTGVHSHEPSQRVDHVFLPANDRYIPRKTEIVLNEPLLQRKDASFPLSDHFGVLIHLELAAVPALPADRTLLPTTTHTVLSEHIRRTKGSPLSYLPPRISLPKRGE
jgi:hypothetical protein